MSAPVDVGAQIRIKKGMRFGRSFGRVPVGVSSINLVDMQFFRQWNLQSSVKKSKFSENYNASSSPDPVTVDGTSMVRI